ncbi:CPD photolyase [Hoplias malabaricus]|uniref:CPD photolyase n=1 Tax=Hoplias malabaricus TaxID=27720 RepID=UPI0034624577
MQLCSACWSVLSLIVTNSPRLNSNLSRGLSPSLPRMSKRRAEPKPRLKRRGGESSPAADGEKKQKTVNGRGERPSGWLQLEVTGLRAHNCGQSFNSKRVRVLSENQKITQGSGGVLYWMARDQRVQDNWALIYAQQLAVAEKLPLHICFCLVPKFLDAAYRQYAFMIRGLQEVAKECKNLKIQFHFLRGDPVLIIPGFVKKWNMGAVVTDFNPLRLPLQWMENVQKELPADVPFMQVDAHNIVPCWEASPKLEYGARTIRGKINKLLPVFLTEFPPVDTHPHPSKSTVQAVDWEDVFASLDVDRGVGEVDWARPGTAAGMEMLESFIHQRLHLFATERNNPNSDALSHLSPWLHCGHVSAQRVVKEVQRWGKSARESVASFTEELVVRRELADNFCFYNKNYDSIDGAYDWARKTLKDHAKDKRSYLYSRDELENGKTHDPLWNAAQRQLLLEGKIHGFMRMYWAKKILEWTSSPEEALSIVIYLNDHYSLDGCDPNGYVGCMWSVCGIHDQGWAERPVFGKVRYMNYAGCKRKFDVTQFERKYTVKTV